MKKVRLSMTIERELLSEVNELVRKKQREALDRKAPLASRSEVLEGLIRRGLQGQRKH
jgi:metal-responsive CopG/Arc/MetJ family transcriptional regulator